MNSQPILRSAFLAACVVAWSGCGKAPVQPGEGPSRVRAAVNPAGLITIKSPTAEFDILPNGYLQAYLVRNGSRLSIDEPEQGAVSARDYVVSAGVEIRDFQLDFARVMVVEARGKLGTRGKRIEISGRASSPEGAALEKTLAVEVYDDLPNVAVTALTFRNAGHADFKLDQVVAEKHRLSAALVDAKAAPYSMWSFHGSSFTWGKDDIVNLTAGFQQPNLLGGTGPQGLGGGIPMVDFWTASVGVAIGHIEPLPLIMSLPVQVAKDGRVEAAMTVDADVVLKPGESYHAPRTFAAVHSGDFYDPLAMWSRAVRAQNSWSLGKTTPQAYQANWCGWGYESDFTPAQMLGAIPKLKQLGYKWATLDLRWHDNYGDWMPRSDTFPGDTLRKLIDEYHKQGILVQAWYQPIEAEDGIGKHGLPKPTTVSRIIKEHPDWAILDKEGKNARLVSPVSEGAAMCPALPEVQEYHKQLVERFFKDFAFDGLKMDAIYSVPPCYNPKHHHKSPEDSIQAVAQLFKTIYDTARQIKPDSIVQICPCGTPPNMAWVFFQNQAVTADPIGSPQVRRRIKLYKAVLGPESAVYGDHVELSEMRQAGTSTNGVSWVVSGSDFASTMGPGGVIGTRFTWPGPPPRPAFRKVQLTPEKEVVWKKWTDLYNAKMIADGKFLNLYTLGYDVPEGYAIEKDGKMYYAFFLPQDAAPWKGEVELRGLKPGRYRVFDYVNSKDLGTVSADKPRLATGFADHLLLEVTKL